MRDYDPQRAENRSELCLWSTRDNIVRTCTCINSRSERACIIFPGASEERSILSLVSSRGNVIANCYHEKHS